MGGGPWGGEEGGGVRVVGQDKGKCESGMKKDQRLKQREQRLRSTRESYGARCDGCRFFESNSADMGFSNAEPLQKAERELVEIVAAVEILRRKLRSSG